jgi:pSer/pThr/pTyr-binding forkhead associated (FHA) protein
MDLQGRDLRHGLTGDDVYVLQVELAVLGYAIPADEQASSLFGEVTFEAVRQFQAARGLPSTGIVDIATAAALSAATLVGAPRLVVLEPAETAGEVLVLSRPEMVVGQADPADLIVGHRSVSLRHARLTVEATGRVTIQDLGSAGGTFVNEEWLEQPRVLHEGDLVRFADLVTRFEPASSADIPSSREPVTMPMRVMSSNPAGPFPEVPPSASDGEAEQPATASAESSATASIFTVTGTVMSPALPMVGVLNAELVDKNVGGDQVLAETRTNSDGTYAFRQVITSPAYLAEHNKTQPDLQVRVYANGQLVGASAVRYSAPAQLSLDVMLPAGAAGLLSEYEILTAKLAAIYRGELGDLREDADQQDITYLANKTGWDARAIALAALADQFSHISAEVPLTGTAATPIQPAPGRAFSLESAFYYALFRAGLPANPDGLFRANSTVAQAIWQEAIAQGVIPRHLESDVREAARVFRALSAAHTLTAAPLVGVSTMQGMLRATLPQTAQQERFAQLYAQYQGDWAGFWPAADQALGPELAKQLRLMGRLYYLTVNNQPLVAALLAAEADNPLTSTDDLASLAARGYYRPAKWAPLIAEPIPPGVPGADATEKARNYAELLAAQIRVAFPTAVIADQVSRGILPTPGPPRTAADVSGFLARHHSDFEIGVEPVEGFVSRTGATDAPDSVITHVKRLQRVYQLTPDDASMAVLLNHNLDSAFAITRYDSAGFVRAFGGKLGGSGKAAAIHARAKHVFASVLSLAVGYLSGRVAPRLGGSHPVLSGLPAQSSTPAYPVTVYPTLEKLFGSLDYCNCPDCRTILSPAAYLADLLHYLDQPAPTAPFQNPQDVLFRRRPDLQYLPLTCANTNTALPYIDIVNEVLEYFVANGLSLDGYQGHDTGDTVSSAELMASPQYVNDAAYEVLKNAYFPPPLPFNRPLELLRHHLRNLGIALPDAMAALRANDKLDNPQTLTSYGWLDVLIEQLGVSRDDYRLFTDSSLQLDALYGLPSALPTLQTMSLQDLSRRLGLSYDDVSAIIQTQFINPNAALIPRLLRLGAPFGKLKTLTVTNLPAGLDPTEYGGSDYNAVIAWIAKTWPLITDIITISRTGESADDCSGADLELRYSNPDNTANLLSGTDFLKLIRFTRLWQKLVPLLGSLDNATSIQLTDNILTALYPANDIPNGGSDVANDPANFLLLDAGFKALLPRLGFLFRVMSQLSLSADSLSRLLVCWAPIGTVGATSLYQALFLTPALLRLEPGAQTATVAPTMDVGDVLHTTINEVPVAPHTVTANETASDAATAIVAALNATTALDPVSNQPLNTRFFATNSGNVITIETGFTLQCEAQGNASETYTAATQSPLAQSATVGGAMTVGDILITTINGVPISYAVAVTDIDLPTLASSIAAAINNSTIQDPYSGLPINNIVAASSQNTVITLIAANTDAPFSLACWIEHADSGTYTAAAPVPECIKATVTGPVKAGDTLVTTITTSGDMVIPGLAVSYTATSTDTDLPTLAASIATAINNAVLPANGWPLSFFVQASSTDNVITIAAVDPAAPVSAVACSVSTGAETYIASAPSPVSVTATVTGPIPAGATLTTTIDGVSVPYIVVTGDTPASIANIIANSINSTTTLDPVANQQLNMVVTATATGNTVTLTGALLTTSFTLECSISTSGYTAQPPVPARSTATITGTVTTGDTLVTTISTSGDVTINPVVVSYVVASTDTDLVTLAASIAAAINADVQNDPTTQLPLGGVIHATSAAGANGAVITITAVDPATPVAVQCSTSQGASETFSASAPIPQSTTATVTAPIAVGATLTTTIDTLPLLYSVVAGDTVSSIAANIAKAINTATTPDPVSNHPLNAIVIASASNDGVITIKATLPTTAFTIACAVSASGYAAGRQNPPFADNGYGEFLADRTQTLFGHESALCAACNLTGAEFAMITATLGFGPTTYLTLPNVSALFRYGWLAHALGMSVVEFLRLREFSRLDPFSPLDPGSSPAEPPVIQFIRLLESFTTAGMTSAQALYLIWNQDISGTFTPATPAVTGLASAVRASFAAVDAQFTLQDDPDGSIAQALMTLVYGSKASGFFFGLLNQTFTTYVSYVNQAGELPATVIAASSGQLSYDDLHEQLIFAGVLDANSQAAIDGAVSVNTTDSTKTAAGPAVFTPTSMANIFAGAMLVIDQGAAQETVTVTTTTLNTFSAIAANPHDGTAVPFPIVSDAAPPSLLAAVASLATASQNAVAPFFASYPELRPLYAAYVASTDQVQARRTALLNNFLPILKQKRKQQQALASITSAASTDPSFATSLLQNAAILHADAEPTDAAITDLTAAEVQGLSAQLFFNNKTTGTPDEERLSAPTLSYTQTATVGSTITTGDVLTTTINGLAIPYQIGATDVSAGDVAGHIAAAINQTTTQDAVTNRPMNQVVSASSAGSLISIAGLDPSGATSYFTLTCSVSAGGKETYTAGSLLATAPGGAPLAAIWSGYLGAPQDGSYDISIATDPGATITLQVNGATVQGQQAGSVWRSLMPITLVAAELAPITLTTTSIKTTLVVSWQSLGLGWQVIPGQFLYPLSLVKHLGNTYVRFLMATSLATALSLTANEIADLGTATTFAVDTTDDAQIAPGSAVFAPASMANIAQGSVLVIGSGPAQETVTVSAATLTTFTATAVNAHDGTVTPFPIVSQSTPQTGQGWLNFLARALETDLATAASLAGVLTALVDFAAMKQALSPSDERLLTVLQDPGAVLPNNQSALLSLTGWAQASLNALLTQFFDSTDLSSLSSVENFRRVYNAYLVVRACRLSAATLISAITNAPTPATVSTLQSALQALYAEPDWLTVIRPISDAARVQQRDALVAYILQQLGDSYGNALITLTTTAAASTGDTWLQCLNAAEAAIGMQVIAPGIAPGTVVTGTSGPLVFISQAIVAAIPSRSSVKLAPHGSVAIEGPNSLYEIFLIDPQTQPPVETSRILLALSTVQLFIERVVRNLEPQVGPSDVDVTQWQWMKRYRVWQANREVFLWPENWLYPELRDNQSPFFQQMTSSLLQGDITDDAAASAYLDYLTSLEQVAKLEPCGLYYQPATTDTDEISHVVARTSGAHRKHFFRQLENGGWTPWAEVQIDCEDVPITPIVWNGRLFLFWLKAVKQIQPKQLKLGTSDPGNTISDFHLSDVQQYAGESAQAQAAGSVQAGAILCWTEFYNGKWQPTKTSDPNRPTTINTFDATGLGSLEAIRSQIRIVPVQFTGSNPQAQNLDQPFSLPGDALILALTVASQSFNSGGFILHNTHSLPVAFDDVILTAAGAAVSFADVLDIPAIIRTLSPSPAAGAYVNGAFAIDYQANGQQDLFSYQRNPSLLEPQPGLPDAYSAPFFYADGRYQFYVMPVVDAATIANFSGFGRPTGRAVMASATPVIYHGQPISSSGGPNGLPGLDRTARSI